MNSSTDNDFTNVEGQPAESSGRGTGRRLLFLLGFFAIAAGAIWGGRYYLDASLPEKDMNFAKKSAPGQENEEEEVPTGLEVIAEWWNGKGPSQDVTRLKEKKESEVAYTYDQIAAMSKGELEQAIAELQEKLTVARADLPPSFGGASMGGGGTQKPESSDDAEPKVTIESLALPLAVMEELLLAK